MLPGGLPALYGLLVGRSGIEPLTSCLSSKRSPAELTPLVPSSFGSLAHKPDPPVRLPNPPSPQLCPRTDRIGRWWAKPRGRYL